MSENIVKGYIIDRRIYKSFDEILLVLIADGQRLPMLALGTKKINSKNARNLHYGSLIEFIIFQSRTVGKMSKLRTATILKENDWKIENRHSFNVLCNCIKKATYTSKEFFKFFEYALKFISENKYDENVLISIILYRFLILNGINVDEDNAFTQKYRIDLISNNLTNLENAKYNKLKDNVNSTNKFLNEYIFYILGIKVL